MAKSFKDINPAATWFTHEPAEQTAETSQEPAEPLKVAAEPKKAAADQKEGRTRRVQLVMAPSVYERLEETLHAEYKATGRKISINEYINTLVIKDIERKERKQNGK